jgi:hypothetical protein
MNEIEFNTEYEISDQRTAKITSGFAWMGVVITGGIGLSTK